MSDSDAQSLSFSQEPLFQPSLLGVDCTDLHENICKSIMECPVDNIHDNLFANIILTGVSTMYRGLEDRL